MISEDIFEKHYEQIAEKLDEIIPTNWDRIVMYAEETGDASAICIYYYTDTCTKVHHSGNIPEECNVDEHIVDSLENVLMLIKTFGWNPKSRRTYLVFINILSEKFLAF